MVHIYNEIRLGHKNLKKSEILPLATTWIDLEDIVLREKSQIKTNAICGIQKTSKQTADQKRKKPPGELLQIPGPRPYP